MTIKSGTLFAFVAAVLMLGCALVPLAAVNGDKDVATDADATSLKDLDLLELYGVLKEGMDNLSPVELVGATLVPVERIGADNDVIVLSGEIREPTTKGDGNTYTLGDLDFYFTDKGRGKIFFEGGTTLQLFPIDGSQSFKLVDHYNLIDDRERFVCLKTGAYLDVFGMKFMIITNHEGDTFDLFGFIAKKADVPPAIEFSYDNTDSDDSMTLTGTVTAGETSVILANMTCDVLPESSEFLNVSGTLKPQIDGAIIEKLKVDILMHATRSIAVAEKEYPVEITVRGGITMDSLSVIVKEDVKSGKLSGSIDFRNMKIANDDKEPWFKAAIKIQMVETPIEIAVAVELKSMDASLSTGDIRFELASNGTGSYDLSIDDENGITMNVADAALEVKMTIDTVEATFLSINVRDIVIAMTNASVKAVIYMGEKTVESNEVKAMADFGITVGSVSIELASEDDPVLSAEDISLKMNSVVAELKNDVEKFTVSEMTLSSEKMTGMYVHNYVMSVDIKISDLVETLDKGVGKTSFSETAELKTLYNGDERVIKLDMKNVALDTGKSGNKLTVDEMELYKDIPNEVLDVISSFMDDMDIPDYIDLRIEGFSTGDDWSTADNVAFTVLNMGLFSEFNLEFDGNVKMDIKKDPETNMGMIIDMACDQVNGSFRNIGGNLEKFVVTDSPKLKAVVSTDESPTTMYMVFDNGNVRFAGGILYLDVLVGKNTKFTSDGTTFRSIVFEDGCQKSGTITLMPNYMTTPINTLAAVVDGEGNQISSVQVTGEGYDVKLNLTDLASGEVKAKTGYVLQDSYDGDGYKTTSNNGSTGKIAITGKDVNINHSALRDSFTLTYADGFATGGTYKYGEQMTITDKEPTREGLKFIGWTDGSRTNADGFDLIEAGAVYFMPARDVVLTPVFMKTVTPEAATEGGKKILVVDAHEANVVDVTDVPVDGWDQMSVKLGDVKVEFSHDTYMRLGLGTEFFMSSLTVGGCDDAVIEKTIEGKTVFGIVIADENMDPVEKGLYDGSTQFKVTVTVEANDSVTGFSVKNFDFQRGYFDNVGVNGYEKLGSGLYSVTFTVNHFSYYSVEPIYNDQFDAYWIVGIAVVAFALFAFFCVFLLRKNRY